MVGQCSEQPESGSFWSTDKHDGVLIACWAHSHLLYSGPAVISLVADMSGSPKVEDARLISRVARS